MFTKLVTLTVLLICLAGGVLLLRQHRIELAHRSARIYAHMERTRHRLWNAQTSTALLLRPEALRRRLEDSRIALEPAVPEPAEQGGRWVHRDPSSSLGFTIP